MQAAGFSFSINLLIIGIFMLALLYGVLLGQDRIKTFVLSVFVGIVLARDLSQPLYDSFLGGFMQMETVRFLLFLAPLVLLEFNHASRRTTAAMSRHKHRDGMIVTLVLSVLAAALVTASVINLADPALQQVILGQSFLALFIFKLRLWWMGLVVLVATVWSLLGGRRPRY